MENTLEMLSYFLSEADPDNVAAVISKIDKIWGECFEEAEQLENLSVCIELEPEQKKRAHDLDQMMSILCAVMNVLYEKDALTPECMEGCKNG